MAESPQPTMQKRTMSLKSFSGETCSSQSDFPTESSLPAFTVTPPLFPPESKTRFLPPIHYLDALSDSTHNSKRLRPSARQRFMPRPRNSTEMRPSMPARKRCPFLKSGLFSYFARVGVFCPPRCGMHTTLTPFCLQDFTFFSLKKPRSEPYNSGAWPKVSLWRSREGPTC